MASVAQILGTNDSGYHADGTIKRGRQIVARVYYCDRVTDSVLAQIQQLHPQVTRCGIRSEYAPELCRVGVVVPTQAELNRRA